MIPRFWKKMNFKLNKTKLIKELFLEINKLFFLIFLRCNINIIFYENNKR
jgi:hypothetical protein